MLYFVVIDGIPSQVNLTNYFPNTSNPECLDLAEYGIHAIQEEGELLSVSWNGEAIVCEWKPQPDWTSFKTALLIDPSFAAIYHVAGQNNLLIKDSLVPSLLQYEAGNTELFPTVFNAFCVAGEVTTEQRQEWRTMAESFHLPSQFLDIISL